MVSRVVTPEAVLVELPTVGPATRALARLIDLVINGFIIGVASTILGVVVELSDVGVGQVAVASIAGFAYLIGLPVGIEWRWRGRSIGKAICGVTVVGADGSRETPRQILVRALVALPEVFLSLGALAMISATLSERGQRLGDLAAGTIVIRSKPARSANVPTAFLPPSGLESYVRSLPVGRLDEGDFVLIRDFLLRATEMNAPARTALGAELADAIRRRLDVVVPFAIDAQMWLECVASAYQFQQGGLMSDIERGIAPLALPEHR